MSQVLSLLDSKRSDLDIFQDSAVFIGGPVRMQLISILHPFKDLVSDPRASLAARRCAASRGCP